MGSSAAAQICSTEICRHDFPEGFIFGTATSAYQVEGSLTEGKRGPCIWDTFSLIPGKIKDGSNAHIACDQYNRYKDDIKLMDDLGFHAYRFSISWSRIFPDGLGNSVNQEGILHYNNVIDCLLERGITPFVTLYHWDLPQVLQDMIGGWLSPEISTYFATYAEACFEAFGDRVKHWITINEPLRFATLGYSLGVHAPGRSSNRDRSLFGNSSLESYIVGHNALLAHAAAVQIYNTNFKAKQAGVIGITVDSDWAEPVTSSPDDKDASQRHLEFSLGWFLDPIFFGQYPTSMRQILGERLPEFTAEQRNLVQGSFDFVGINHYSSGYVTRNPLNSSELGWFKDINTKLLYEKDGKPIGEKGASFWMYIVPWGFGKLLKWITERYDRPPIIVTENGLDDENVPIKGLSEFTHDTKRVKYYQDYLFYVAQAIREGADIRGYFAWSFLDNFEWAMGYTKRYGIVFVDYNDNLKRYPKDSALWFQKFLKN